MALGKPTQGKKLPGEYAGNDRDWSYQDNSKSRMKNRAKLLGKKENNLEPEQTESVKDEHEVKEVTPSKKLSKSIFLVQNPYFCLSQFEQSLTHGAVPHAVNTEVLEKVNPSFFHGESLKLIMQSYNELFNLKEQEYLGSANNPEEIEGARRHFNKTVHIFKTAIIKKIEEHKKIEEKNLLQQMKTTTSELFAFAIEDFNLEIEKVSNPNSSLDKSSREKV